MSHLRIKDADGTAKYLSMTGTGTDLDPLIPTQAVTGPLTDAQLRAAAVTVAQERVLLTSVTGTVDQATDNTVIVAPAAGHYIVFHSLGAYGESADAVTVTVKAGATAIDRIYCPGAGLGRTIEPQAGKEIVLPAATALILALDAAHQVGYTVRYTIEAL